MRPLTLGLGCSLAISVLAAPVPRPKEAEFYQPGWDKPIDPDRDCRFISTKRVLTIEVPGTLHELVPPRKRTNAPRLLRTVEGDFTVQVRVSGSFSASERASVAGDDPYAKAGLLLVFGDKQQKMARLTFGTTRHKQQSKAGISFAILWPENDGGMVASVHEGDEDWPLARKATSAYLRFERKGDRLRSLVSPDKKTWEPLPAYDLGKSKTPLPNKLKVGLGAFSTSKDQLKARFDEFSLIPGKNAQRK